MPALYRSSERSLFFNTFAGVRRSLATFFLLLYAISFTEVHQALRLPILLEHYQEHAANAELTFWDFLVMHYETDEAHDETDNSLPFKDCGHAANIPTVALACFYASPQNQLPTTDTDHPSFYLSRSPQRPSVDIFQPPKV